jgi:hypothetical protein
MEHETLNQSDGDEVINITDVNTSEPEPVIVITPEPGYNFDMVLTYKMIEDTDDQDTLFRIQFLQVFGITTNEYQPDVVSGDLDALYVRFRENVTIQEILQSHPLYHKERRGSHGGGNGEGVDAEDSGSGIVLSSDNSEMIFCMMFSFQTFDLFHACLRYASHNEAIPESNKAEIIECFRQMF